MMPIMAGDAAIAAIMVGDAPITRVYRGAERVFGEAPPDPGHRYWRVFIVENQGEVNYTALSRLQMFSSAVHGAGRIDMCSGGTPIYSTQGGALNTEVAANAFDDANNTIWATRPSGAARNNSYIGYDFGAGNKVNIDRFTIQVRGTDLTQAPKDIKFEWSDDGSNWTTVYTPSSLGAWSANEERLFTLPSYAPASYSGSPHGAHRYWRLHFQLSNSGGTTYSAAEVEMRATPGGADQCNGGTASAHSVFSGFPASNAFDNSNSTLWSANGNSVDGWLKYDFGTPVSVAEIMIRARNDASFTQTPRYGMVEFSDDDTHWSSAWQYAMASSYAAGTAQTSTDPAYV